MYDVIIINNKIRHNSFTIFTTRRVLHTEPYFLQNIFILSVWPLRGHLAARGVTNIPNSFIYISNSISNIHKSDLGIFVNELAIFEIHLQIFVNQRPWRITL